MEMDFLGTEAQPEETETMPVVGGEKGKCGQRKATRRNSPKEGTRSALWERGKLEAKLFEIKTSRGKETGSKGGGGGRLLGKTELTRKKEEGRFSIAALEIGVRETTGATRLDSRQKKNASKRK